MTRVRLRYRARPIGSTEPFRVYTRVVEAEPASNLPVAVSVLRQLLRAEGMELEGPIERCDDTSDAT